MNETRHHVGNTRTQCCTDYLTNIPYVYAGKRCLGQSLDYEYLCDGFSSCMHTLQHRTVVAPHRHVVMMVRFVGHGHAHAAGMSSHVQMQCMQLAELD